LPSKTEKPAGWLWSIPTKVQRGVLWAGHMQQVMFLIENSAGGMTVGMRDIGFPGFITNCRIYDRDMLIHKEAQELSDVLKSQNDDYIRTYIFGEMRKNLENYDPDFFLYTPTKHLNPKLFRWNLFDRMYNDYFNTHMDIIKKFYTPNKTLYVCYRKKGLSWRPTTEELIRKYEKIIRKNPWYPAFHRRLNELYLQLKGPNRDTSTSFRKSFGL
jgi:hypothetical protein